MNVFFSFWNSKAVQILFAATCALKFLELERMGMCMHACGALRPEERRFSPSGLPERACVAAGLALLQ
jgi:hypothetical protein